MLEHLVNARLPTEFGLFTLHMFKDQALEIPVLTQLDQIKELPLVRMHSSCVTGDIFHSKRCDCGEQLAFAMQEIQKYGGVLVYLPQEGRGIGLLNKIKAYALQDEEGLDTVEANIKLGLPIDARSYESVAKILTYFKIKSCELLTNNPHKVQELESYGITVRRKPLIVDFNAENRKYLEAKIKKLGHLL